MRSTITSKLTAELLDAYSKAALSNAEELLKEASLLRDHDHMARAYFLAVSSIEEAGKALLAFEGQHRNLSDPAVCTRLVAGLKNHTQKINYALSMWALNGSDPRGDLQVALDLIGQLGRGRESSMYSEIGGTLPILCAPTLAGKDTGRVHCSTGQIVHHEICQISGCTKSRRLLVVFH